VTGVPYPLDLNEASMDELTAIPGVGKSTAGDIVVGRPYESVEDVPDVDLSDYATVGAVPRAD
jgi:DNA uptake protein ComE-like DNA-binding protein